MTAPTHLFDRACVRRNRQRWASRGEFEQFLHQAVGSQILERVQEVRRDFRNILVLGDHGGVLDDLPGQVIRTDLAEACLAGYPRLAVAIDDERLPFKARQFDLVVSLLNLHWVNDLPGALAQINHVMTPDGFFLAALFGGGTLSELRECLALAESELVGGVTPRVSPFPVLSDVAGLLQRAGFALPVADADNVTVSYPSALKLMDDLRRMGEANSLAARSRGLMAPRTLARAAQLYAARHTTSDDRIEANFVIHYLAGWAPGDSQPKPLRPGSAQQRLANYLKTSETKLDPGSV